MSHAQEIVHEEMLDNGMKVLIIPDHRAPVATHMVWYEVGSADEQLGKSGIAHFLEHLMFKGTKTVKGGKFGEVVASLGGQENAFTSNDYTAYYQRIAPQHLKTMMEFESDRMRNLALSPEDVATERDVVLEERRQRTDNDPSAKLYEKLTNKLWENHPYGIPIIGWEKEIEQLNREDAFDVYNTFYSPKNATLIVAGDVARETILKSANETYGKIKVDLNVPKRNRRVEAPRLLAETVEHRDEKVQQPQLSRSYRVPSSRLAKGLEAESLDIFSTLLGGGASSRLYKELVVEQEIAVNAGSYYQATAYDEGRFMIYATPRDGVTLDHLEIAIDKIIGEIALKGVTESEMTRAKTRLIAESIYAQDKQATLAQIYGACLKTGLTVQQVLGWTDRVKQVKAQDVASIVPLFARHKSVSGHLLPLSVQS